MPLYRRLIAAFLRARATVDAQLSTALAADDAPAMGRVAHALRGAAGTIGARVVMAAAAELERACDDGLQADDRSAQVVRVQVLLEELLTALRRIQSQLDAEHAAHAAHAGHAGHVNHAEDADRASKTTGAAPAAPAALGAAGRTDEAADRDELLRLLQADDATAVDVAERMRAVLAARRPLDERQLTLMAALDATLRFDFPEARDRLLSPHR